MNRFGSIAAFAALALGVGALDIPPAFTPLPKAEAKVVKNNPAGSKYRRKKARKHSQIGRLFRV